VTLTDAWRSLDREYAWALGGVLFLDGGAEGLEQTPLSRAGLGTRRKVGEEIGRHARLTVPAIYVLGYSVRVEENQTDAVEPTMKGRYRNADLQA